jgi:methionine-rich copper-binding protein CopC
MNASSSGVLLESVPKARETVAVVKRLDLRFNSRIEPAGPNWLTAPLPPLEPGLYTVRWRVLTVDGHLSGGSFSFRVAEGR